MYCTHSKRFFSLCCSTTTTNTTTITTRTILDEFRIDEMNARMTSRRTRDSDVSFLQVLPRCLTFNNVFAKSALQLVTYVFETPVKRFVAPFFVCVAGVIAYVMLVTTARHSRHLRRVQLKGGTGK